MPAGARFRPLKSIGTEHWGLLFPFLERLTKAHQEHHTFSCCMREKNAVTSSSKKVSPVAQDMSRDTHAGEEGYVSGIDAC